MSDADLVAKGVAALGARRKMLKVFENIRAHCDTNVSRNFDFFFLIIVTNIVPIAYRILNKNDSPPIMSILAEQVCLLTQCYHLSLLFFFFFCSRSKSKPIFFL